VRRRWIAVTALGLLGLPAACSDDGPKEGEARLEVEGRATVERAGGDRETVDGGANVSPGDRVSMLEGVAVMRLAGGTQLELRQGLDPAANTVVVMGTRPVLEAGDLLVTTSDSFGLEADGTEVEVTEGTARLTRSFGMGVAAYDADVALDSAGVTAEVPALRQMVVPDLGRPPQEPKPIEYNGLDTWDRRYLGAAMDLGGRLDDLARGLTNTLPDGEGRTPGFFKIVLPGLEDEPDFSGDLLDLDRAPGDTLIGAAITELGDDGSFTSRWNEVFSFHDDGAAWGIVALDQSVESEPLMGTVEEALNSFGEAAEFVQPPTSTPPGTTPSTTPGGDPSDPGGTDGGSDGGTTTTPPPTDAPPATPPSTPPVTPPSVEPPPALEPVVDPVADLVDDLLGGLLGGSDDPPG
jgi:hypothetical protein